eukprot:jgi/Chrpa1/19061/Chrysochromulina_OHIO_Genome00024067-RA
MPVPANWSSIQFVHSINIIPHQREGGNAEHNPFVLPIAAGLATATNLAGLLRREILYPYCAHRVGVSVNSLAADDMFSKIFPSGQSAFIAAKDRGKPTGLFIVQIAPGYVQEIALFLSRHALGFLVTVDQGEFATSYNKAVAIERKIMGQDVSVAEVARAIYKMTGFVATVLYDRNYFDHHIFAFEVDQLAHRVYIRCNGGEDSIMLAGVARPIFDYGQRVVRHKFSIAGPGGIGYFDEHVKQQIANRICCNPNTIDAKISDVALPGANLFDIEVDFSQLTLHQLAIIIGQGCVRIPYRDLPHLSTILTVTQDANQMQLLQNFQMLRPVRDASAAAEIGGAPLQIAANTTTRAMLRLAIDDEVALLQHAARPAQSSVTGPPPPTAPLPLHAVAPATPLAPPAPRRLAQTPPGLSTHVRAVDAPRTPDQVLTAAAQVSINAHVLLGALKHATTDPLSTEDDRAAASVAFAQQFMAYEAATAEYQRVALLSPTERDAEELQRLAAVAAPMALSTPPPTPPPPTATVPPVPLISTPPLQLPSSEGSSA